MALNDEDWAIAMVAQRLCHRFAGIEAEEIERVVDECRATFDGRPVRAFVAVLVEKMASDRLRAIRRTPPNETGEVPFSSPGHGQWMRRALAEVIHPHS